ncbi:hypothetical protein [Streptomyces sp. NPDC059224]|uniref:hypothetical protein n=1 Tax=Streptomyces sp. NPDC059224 TaxID=3346775 RepID=UPI0036CAC470
MNTRRVNTAADVINRALMQTRTAAGIALALESAQLLMSPETAAELEQLRARVAELEAAPLAFAEQLDAKSLDNFLISLGSAAEHEPMGEAINRVHEVIRSFRDGLAAMQDTAPVVVGQIYWRAAEPDVRVKVTRVWTVDGAAEPSIAFDIRGRDWRGRPATSFSALRVGLFRQLYRLDTTVTQPATGGAS